MRTPRAQVVRGAGPLRPTLARELLQARARLETATGVVETIALVMRRLRHDEGLSQRAYALRRGWSKSFQARLESCAQNLMLRDVVDALTGTGFVLALLPDGDPSVGAVDGWSTPELIARDRGGRRFPAAREVQRATRPPTWWWWKHSTNSMVGQPEWTTAVEAHVRGVTATVMTMNEIRVRPKLAVEGAERAIEFYQEVLGARLQSRHTMGEAVVFAQLELPSGDVLQVKDADHVDRAPGPDGAGVIIDVLCDDPDTVVAAAVERGAEVIFEVADQPYGARQGRIRDPFGHQWIVGTELTKSDAEVQAALDDWAAAEGTSRKGAEGNA
ncbi:VOC family protein [Ornithinimicrobium cryptoxanthini]|uniref:VOC family protein n=1 Tax=Ornithinimicrobium cryptoxanthini TaxID=2934161 RepID=A0ABY4YIK8_9MICO|nr:VOC family protein [Ornithinimicrobium cryptoxanthini]USQ76631.1 VOC family protein [Ornithinimicrobium cryptoxanthini]